jgi:hypothetical protein
MKLEPLSRLRAVFKLGSTKLFSIYREPFSCPVTALSHQTEIMSVLASIMWEHHGISS